MTEVLTATQMVADVAVPLPITGLFSYEIPSHLETSAQPGVRVLVTFKNRELIGYLVGLRPQTEPSKLKPILGVLDESPVLSAEILALTRDLSNYYASSWGEAIENALPKWVKYGKKADRALRRSQKSDGAPSAGETPSDFVLSEDQKRCLEGIQKALKEFQPKPILLYGVTGSGKTEVYIRAIREVLQEGKSAICLVPEIALTEQIKRFFHRHFGNELEILHSKLSDGDRFLAWKHLDQGMKRVVLGPRSAVFAPVRRLGLLIIDEEHEGSYKQETTPRYHARDVARWRAGHEKALLLLGSATPSLETMYRSQLGEIQRMDLRTRIDDKKMPAVQIIDLREQISDKKKMILLSHPLAREIETNLRRREGTLILLNRRGFSTHVHCPKCGYVESCKSCHVSLTFHQEEETLLCHYCQYKRPATGTCSQCKMPLLRFAGFGTEKVESEIAKWFPRARIARMDADSVRRKGSHIRLLQDFREQKTDILIGTQMIAKGFDFPHVTLVGVILADVGLMLPDFRSSERTFQLLTQFAGRAGRGDQPGRVLIQTYSPRHPSVLLARTHDYPKFYEQEVSQRRTHQYPPFRELVNIIVRSRDEKKCYLAARALRDLLRESLNPGNLQVEIIGPAQLPFYKLRGHFRWHLMLKAPRDSALGPEIRRILEKFRKPSNVALAVDVDPLNIL